MLFKGAWTNWNLIVTSLWDKNIRTHSPRYPRLLGILLMKTVVTKKKFCLMLSLGLGYGAFVAPTSKVRAPAMFLSTFINVKIPAPLCNILWRHRGGSRGILPHIPNLRAKWDGWSPPRPGHCIPGREVRYPSQRRFGGFLGRSGRAWRGENFWPPPGFEPRTVHGDGLECSDIRAKFCINSSRGSHRRHVRCVRFVCVMWRTESRGLCQSVSVSVL